MLRGAHPRCRVLLLDGIATVGTMPSAASVAGCLHHSLPYLRLSWPVLHCDCDTVSGILLVIYRYLGEQ